MNARLPVARRVAADVVFYSALIVVVVAALTLLLRRAGGSAGWMFTKQLLAIFVISVPLAAVLALAALPRARRFVRETVLDLGWGGQTRWRLFGARPRHRPIVLEGRIGGRPVRAAIVVPAIGRLAASLPALSLAIVALALCVLDERLFVVALGLLQGEIAVRCAPARLAALRPAVLTMSAAGWCFCAGMPYTHLGDWLLQTRAAPAAIPVFCAVSLLAAWESGSGSGRPVRNRAARIGALAVVAVFAIAAFRTDHLTVEWVPIHRSYFADVAQWVRDGHWLLWDTPSLYGFLSILTIALFPAPNAWQALYVVTGIVLAGEGAIVFALARWRRTGAANLVWAALLGFAAVFAEALVRYPWGPRLYPQGGLRFLWIDLLLFVLFLLYAWRDRPRRRRALIAAGYAIWCIAVLWSIENAVWVTVAWLPSAYALSLEGRSPNLRTLALRAASTAATFSGLAAMLVGVISAVYLLRLHALPDWRGFIEYTGLFTSGEVNRTLRTQNFGGGWSLLVVLGTLGGLTLTALRRRAWALARFSAGAWLAAWAASSYYAVEPLEMYVQLLLAVTVPAIAIAAIVSRELERTPGECMAVRMFTAPVLVLAIATTFASPALMQSFGDFGGAADVVSRFTPVHGELADALHRAGFEPGDPVLLPNGPYWTEPDQGLIQPAIRDRSGRIRLLHAWLPMSPAGPQLLFSALPEQRRELYVARALARDARGGWLITYRAPASCPSLSARLMDASPRTASANFSVVRCAVRRTARR